MQVENHKEEAPFAHYAELFRDLNPAAVTARLSDCLLYTSDAADD